MRVAMVAQVIRRAFWYGVVITTLSSTMLPAATAGDLSRFLRSLERAHKNVMQDVQDKIGNARRETERSLEQGEAEKKKATSPDQRAAAEQKIDAATNDLELLTTTEKYIDGEPTPPERLQQVEEVVRWLTRNVWVACQGAPWMNEKVRNEYGPVLSPYLSHLRSSSRAVGLITSYDVNAQGEIERARQVIGTAVAVGRRQVVTNKHVIRNGGLGYADVEDSSKMKLFSRISGRIAFPVEYPRCSPPPEEGVQRVAIVGIDYVDPTLDFVIARVDGDLANTVSFASERDIVSGDRVVVIGYPTRPGDSETFLSAAQIDEVFRAPDGRTPFPVQRMAEGYALQDEPGLEGGYFRYDATTWGGNSGSLVMSLATGHLIGLHSRGLQARDQGAGYNEAIDAQRISSAISRAGILLPDLGSL